MSRTTYEGEGPQCPCCGRQYTADEGCYYDEQRYTEETCDECGETFDVEVCSFTNWRCTERPKQDEPDPEALFENDYPACPTCGAPAGMDCRTIQGRTQPHESRLSPSPVCSRGVL